MEDAGVGWITAIIVGGIAGWLAEQFMKSNMGLIMNIVLGIVGAAIASAILSYFGIALGGMGRLPSFRLHRRSLAALDRPGDTARLKPSEARSAGGVPTVGKRYAKPSRCRSVLWGPAHLVMASGGSAERDDVHADTAGINMPAFSASV